MKSLNNPYEEYPNRPKIIDLDSIPRIENFVDLIPPTFADLSESINKNTELFNDFEAEKKQMKPISGGVFVYYPADKKLVRFAPMFWHRLTLISRNSLLLRDPKMKKDWREIRQIFESAVIAVAGCSVGGNIIHAIVQDLRPLHIKIADSKEFKISNANRVKITYKDIGQNKAFTVAEQIHAIDPFIKISVYHQGIGLNNSKKNIQHFINGCPAIEEPKATLIIDEIDDLKMKLEIRKEARKAKIPVIMATDIGSAVLLDIRRYDIDPLLPFAPDVADKKLEKLADEKDFYGFFKAIVGIKNLPDEFKSVLDEQPPLFNGAPQLGSTAMVAGGIAAEAAARILLGWNILQ